LDGGLLEVGHQLFGALKCKSENTAAQNALLALRDPGNRRGYTFDHRIADQRCEAIKRRDEGEESSQIRLWRVMSAMPHGATRRLPGGFSTERWAKHSYELAL